MREMDITSLHQNTTVVLAAGIITCQERTTSKIVSDVFEVRFGYPISKENVYSEEGNCYVQELNRA